MAPPDLRLVRRLRRHAPALVPALLALLLPTGPAAAQATVSFFVIQRDGNPVGTFQTCRGLGSETEVIEFREGGETGTVRKIPGDVKCLDLVCTRTLTSDTALAGWRAEVDSGDPGSARSSATVTGFDAGGTPLVAFRLEDAWPSELELVGGIGSTVERVVIVHEGIERTQ